MRGDWKWQKAFFLSEAWLAECEYLPRVQRPKPGKPVVPRSQSAQDPQNIPSLMTPKQQQSPESRSSISGSYPAAKS